MENKINIAEILKDCPKGMELDCVVYNNLSYDYVNVEQARIYCKGDKRDTVWFTIYGCVNLAPSAKCVIFPKGKTTWEGFQRPFKDGDIVTCKDGGLLVASIYKERKNTESFNHHIALYRCLGVLVNGEIALTDGKLRFATEEEKQKLFDAIKANGYKWNPETKTLEKLVEPKFKVGDRIKEKQSNIIGEIIDVQKNKYNVRIDDKGLYLYFREQDNWELAPDKFDINTLKPFDKVLVRDTYKQIWIIDFFSHKIKGLTEGYKFACIGHCWQQCVPYEGNEHLFNTTNDCDEFYKV